MAMTITTADDYDRPPYYPHDDDDSHRRQDCADDDGQHHHRHADNGLTTLTTIFGLFLCGLLKF